MADETYQKIAILVDDKDYQRYLAEAEQHERLITGLRTVGGKAAVQALNATERAQKQANAAAQKAHKEEQAALTALFAAQERYASELLRQQETAAGLSAEQQQLNAFIRKTEEAMKSGTITAQQYGDAQAVIKQRQTALTAGMQASGQAAKSNAAGFQQLSFQLNDVVTQLASGTAPSQVFAQQGGQIVQAFHSAPGLFTAVASGVSSLATAGSTLLIPFLSVAVPLWYDYQTATEAAARGQDTLNTALEESEPLIDRALGDQKRLTELRRGSMTVDEKKAEVERLYREDLAASNATLEESIAADEAWLATNSAAQAGWAERSAAVKAARKAIEDNTATAETGIETAKLLIDYDEEGERASRALADAKEREAKARKSAADAAAKAAERAAWIAHVNQLEAERTKTYEDQIAALSKLQAAGEKASQSEVERVEASANAQREAAREAMVRGKTVAQTARESEQVERAYQDALRGIWAGEQAAYADLKAKEVEEAKKAADKALQDQIRRMDEGFSATADTVGATSDLFGAYYDYISADADKMSQQQKDTALKVWKAQQALAIAEAGVNTIKGVSIALASAPPPLNLIPAGVAAAQGAAQIAAIASSPAPTFDDTPGAVMARTGKPVEDRANVSLHRDDIMIAGKTPGSVVGQAMALAGASAKRSIAGEMARNPVERLLTRDVERAARGRRR